MVQLTRTLFVVLCGGSLTLAPVALAEEADKKPIAGEKERAVEKAGREKAGRDKARPEKDGPAKDRPERAAGQDKPDRAAGRDKPDRTPERVGKDRLEQEKAGQAPQEPRRANQVRVFNERDYTRLKMGPNGPLPADKTRSNAARAGLEEAKADLTRALANTSGNSFVQTENELWRDDEYRLAQIDLRRAQAHYDNVRQPIFAMLREDDYYQQLQKKQSESQRVIQSLVLTGRGSFDYLFPHALAALEMRKRMTREEIIALSQMPEVESAREQMLLAAARVREIRAARVGDTGGARSASAVRQELEAARERVKEAQAAVTAAQLEEAEYERIRYNYVEEWRRTGNPPPVN